uniref:Importin N-terminal domain-containing protein n=1 Tax=Chromera velia CCMP2878 TaxID=1169474 RepID=A0A0G4GSC2_9ALVE|eukprot:Cvel_5132.t1-p1 / transcript=Cvel_5132.t1 / gene=Cvel_5132 / organism=Chromera_velia_CCMP2878 / gene_product=Exportin-1, putative / transcript_product=Exportin-1, putative / location=Cvel_scaffold235:3635-15826(+) / protein_length=1262 / sequence_SO=supercontig / SO=protein_coding / is_pseudo=false
MNFDPSPLLSAQGVPYTAEQVQMLDAVVGMMFSGNQMQRARAHEVLNSLKADPTAFLQVNPVLSMSTCTESKFFALTVLEDAIKVRWKVLPPEQREGIKSYVVNLAIEMSSTPDGQPVANPQGQHLLTKVNETIVQVLKHEWPHNWTAFIPEICNSAMRDQGLCQNNLKILNLLSEEVFDFSSDQMTSKRARIMKRALREQFEQIFQLCQFIFISYKENGSKVSVALLETTLKCLRSFLRWMPLAAIFDTDLIPTLLDSFWPLPQLRIETTRCIGEILTLNDMRAHVPSSVSSGVQAGTSSVGAGPGGEDVNVNGTEKDVGRMDSETEMLYTKAPHLVELFRKFIEKVAGLPDLTWRYHIDVAVHMRNAYETLVSAIVYAITGFFKHHTALIERERQTNEAGIHQHLASALQVILRSTAIPHDDTFKMCLEAWYTIAYPLAKAKKRGECGTGGTTDQGGAPLMLDGAMPTPKPVGPHIGLSGDNLYLGVLADVRGVLIDRMVKPDEVAVHYDDETGEVTKESYADTEENALYSRMRDVLVYLTVIDPAHMADIITKRLELEVPPEGSNGSVFNQVAPRAGAFPSNLAGNPELQPDWNPQHLERLCWATGSITGAMSENEEKNFLVNVIRVLLALCENKKGKPNKAIVATQIMYVVGQYPRFLRGHWKFLKTVLNKLFEFMQETFEGVQEMAVSTFLKIVKKTAKEYVVPRQGEEEPFIFTAFRHVSTLTVDLQQPQMLTFFEGMAWMIPACMEHERPKCVTALVAVPCEWWSELIARIKSDPSMLQPAETAKNIAHVLRIFTRVAIPTGTAFSAQMMAVYPEMLDIYRSYSQALSQVESSADAAKASRVTSTQKREWRAVKRQTLVLVETFVDRASLEAVLGPDALLQEVYSSSDSSNNIRAVDIFLGGRLGEMEASRIEAARTVLAQIAQHTVPPLLHPVLEDYRHGVPQSRDPAVLSLLTVLIACLSESLAPEIPRIFEFVFDCTLDMIRSDFQSFPDHRKEFFELLGAVNKSCFSALFSLKDNRLKLYVECLVWALKHEQPQLAEKGLKVMMEFVDNICGCGDRSIMVSFFQEFFFSLLADVTGVLTDTLHTAGFREQAYLMMRLLSIVEANVIPEVAQKPAVVEFLQKFFLENFPTVTEQQMSVWATALITKSGSKHAFTQVLKDFLISIKAYAGDDDSELFQLIAETAPQAGMSTQTSTLVQSDTCGGWPGTVAPCPSPQGASLVQGPLPGAQPSPPQQQVQQGTPLSADNPAFWTQ